MRSSIKSKSTQIVAPNVPLNHNSYRAAPHVKTQRICINPRNNLCEVSKSEVDVSTPVHPVATPLPGVQSLFWLTGFIVLPVSAKSEGTLTNPALSGKWPLKWRGRVSAIFWWLKATTVYDFWNKFESLKSVNSEMCTRNLQNTQIQLVYAGAPSAGTFIPALRRTAHLRDDARRYSVTSHRHPRLFPTTARRISVPRHQGTTHTVRIRVYFPVCRTWMSVRKSWQLTELLTQVEVTVHL